MKTKIKPLIGSMILAGLPYSASSLAQSETFFFDSALVNGHDVSRFNDGQQSPGTYLVSVAVNDSRKKITSYQIEFGYVDSTLTPNLKKEDLVLFNINPDALKLRYRPGEKYIDFRQGDLQFSFAFYGMSLVLYAPAKAIMNKPSELAHESQWDDGITAFILNYDAKAWHREVKFNAPSSESYSLSLAPGLNVGSWRLRNSGLWQRSYNGESTYQNAYTYAESDIRSLKSKLLIGESSSGSDIFNSIPFRGIKLATSDSMIPFYDRTFVPAVRGIASGVAQVEVRQNNYLIYSTEVPAGAFELTDIPALRGEDMEVTVTESNGTVQHFTVPYNTPAISLKAGRLKYEITLGKYRPYSDTENDDFFSNATLIYGFNDFLTGYTGLQASNKFWSGALGLGFNLYRFGALSIDGVSSRNGYHDNETGSALRIRYSKLINETNTSFNLASYRYASNGYSTFTDAMAPRRTRSPDPWRKKHDSSISLKQDLSRFGSLDLSLRATDYWDKKSESYANVNYSTSLFGRASLSLGWNRVLNADYRHQEDIFSAAIYVSLGSLIGAGTNSSLRYQILSERDRSISNSLSLNGIAYDNRLSWNISQGINSKNDDNKRTSLSAALTHPFGAINGMYNYSPSVTQFGGGINGSMVLHRGGITLGQRIYGAAALLDVDNAADIAVTNRSGVKTDDNGFALVTALNTYRKNDIYIKQADLNSQTEIKQTVSSVIPTDNALVLASYKAVSGKKALFHLSGSDGKPLPFGAVVATENQHSAGIVGDVGEVFLSGLSDSGVLHIRWGNHSGQQCRISYALKEKNSVGLYISALTCS
ncbi:fimbrial biogenesis outer membrane usher protein [Edwardsiella piscicida]|uniref:fimbria/pilus outer membrane usher protein n=1 Tax=Edwardsiella piscicida TaxID=1263550 RepID=UPI001CECB6AF|nr:fimbria/pilus outer membrane usher protein [Edwardsiella piscicida]AOP42635.2 fimbrial biogenesis outer membrane usher protein [Edwardsiella piscicida]UCQ58730.1 fimbrial biogenesis outer membrane usher protein [Edwardsiella piscicida]